MWLLALAAVVVGVPAAAWLAQDRLIFFPQPVDGGAPMPPRVVAIEVAGDDGTRLRGWIRPAARTPAPAVIYFGGNAEEVSWTIAAGRWPETVNVVSLNYRGYGASEGTPGERALVADALAIHAFVAGRPEVDPRAIFAFGRSLGTGVAVQLAAARPLAGIVLASPYDSLVEVARGHYPWLPVSLLLRHRFASSARAPGLAIPMLALVASDDAIIPVERSRALYDAWAGPKRWVAIPATDHNTLAAPGAFWSEVARFLDDPAR
jgi:uncharacterized protein